MQIFESHKKNLLPSFLIWAIFFSIPLCLLLVATKLDPLVIIFVIPGFSFFYVILRWLSVAVPKITIRADENGLTVEKENQALSVPWNEINGIKFFSSGGGLTILVGKFAKFLGFYQLETKQGNIDLPSTLDNLDILLKLIIEKGRLKKSFPTLERSFRGGVFETQMGWGNYPFWRREENYIPNEEDLNTNVGGISKSGILLFIVLLIAVVLIFIVFQLLFRKGII